MLGMMPTYGSVQACLCLDCLLHGYLREVLHGRDRLSDRGRRLGTLPKEEAEASHRHGHHRSLRSPRRVPRHQAKTVDLPVFVAS